MTDNPAKIAGKKVCQLCGKGSDSVEIVSSALVRPAISALIKKDHPQWSDEGYICTLDLDKYRNEHISSLLDIQRGELSSMEKEVLESLKKEDLLSSHVDDIFETRLGFSEKLSDKIASFGGSWTFIIFFIFIIFGWMLLNSFILIFRPFDPYPYIFLNLILSSMSAIQAPIILMSQNRQDAKDRLRAIYDYKVSLKTEVEIRQIHQKIDHLLFNQWKRLVEIQEIQLDLMNEIKKIQSL